MLQFVPHDAVTSSGSGALIARLFPPRRVSATAPVEIEEGVVGGNGNRRLLQLFGALSASCPMISKSHVGLGICAQEPEERTF